MLTPNATYTINGVKVNEKIIPDGTLWKDDAKAKRAGFTGKGDVYKKGKKLSGGTGKPKSLTIHNTNDLDNVNDDAEQYTRATYNENMGSSRVHFYVDDNGAWQNLKAGTGMCPNDPEGSAEVSWHSGDGSVADGGNMTSLSMEIIMAENATNDAKARDNGARIAAWLLWKHGLTIKDLLTHTYWVNKAAGKTFADVDTQCTNHIAGKKWCPTYIFKSRDPAVAKKNWLEFKALVQKYLDDLSGATPSAPTVKPTKPTTPGVIYRVQVGAFSVKANADKLVAELKSKGYNAFVTSTQGATTPAAPVVTLPKGFKEGDKVKCNTGVTKFSNGVKMASWIPTATLYVRKVESSGKVLLVSTEPTKTIYTGRVNASDVHKI